MKGFTEEDANWISGGATSFVHVPYMLRLSRRQIPLQGNLIAGLTPKLVMDEACDGPLDCVSSFGSHLADRALAGLNRVMEQGVEPLARMIWAPSSPTKPADAGDSDVDLDRAPLREPPITADPLVLREQPALIPESEPAEPDPDDSWTEPQPFAPLPPDLPPPTFLDEPPANPAEVLLDGSADAANADRLEGAPPPPELPPLPPAPLPGVPD